MNPEDAWCDWCGESNEGSAYRYDGRVFCSLPCIRGYQTGRTAPKVTDLNEWVDRGSKDSPPPQA